MCRVDGRFTAHTVPIPDQNVNQITSISPESFSTLTSLKTLWLVRDAHRRASPHQALYSSSISTPACVRGSRHLTPLTLPIPEQGVNQLTSIPPGSFSNLTSLQTLDLVRDAPRPALAPIAHLGAPHPAMRCVKGRFTPYTLLFPEQFSNLLASIPSG